MFVSHSDVLHPNRANVSKDELRSKLSELYKSTKDQVSVFGFRTQYGGGKSTGFALIYDSKEALIKFDPHYRLVRYGLATKVEKASRAQRKYPKKPSDVFVCLSLRMELMILYREATEEPSKDCERYGKDEDWVKGQEEIEELLECSLRNHWYLIELNTLKILLPTLCICFILVPQNLEPRDD